MTKKNDRNLEIQEKSKVFFKYLDDEYMTREIYEWNCKFTSDYQRLADWTNEDETMMYTRKKVAEELGFDGNFDRFWEFRSHVRRQIIAYRERTTLEMHEAGKTNAEIAEYLTVGDYETTEKTVERMLKRLLG